MRFETFPTSAQWEMANASFMERLTVNPTAARANKAKSAAIDDLVKRYNLVLDMSKLNILMALREAIIAWAVDRNYAAAARAGRPAPSNQSNVRSMGTLCHAIPARDAQEDDRMQALLDITLRTIAELDGWGRHRYVKAACIGYQLKTGAYEPSRKPASAELRRQADEADIAKSCVDLVGAIQQAQTAYQHYVNTKGVSSDADRKTLKIFMAPEFFFRGRYGAYQDIGLCAKIMETMRNEIRDSKYADWLFVHGTAVFASERDAAAGGGVYLENYALVQKGGVPSKTSDLVVAKEFPSHIDFEHPTVDAFDWYDPAKSEAKIGGDDVKHLAPAGGRKDPQKSLAAAGAVCVSELVGGALFTMDNITFGLEVCRDHFIGRLAHCKEAGKALIQLIPSAGIDIIDGSLGCQMDGIVFNVDGGSPHCDARVRSTLIEKQPIHVATEKRGSGEIKIFSPSKIPWPEQAPLAVAQRLDITRGALSGVEPLAMRA
jgi:hypothetical protein